MNQTLPEITRAEATLGVTPEALADQGVAYTKYQQRLVFVWGGQAFNALTVLSLWPALGNTNVATFLPNAVGRPTRVSGDHVMRLAREAYFSACEQYERDVEEYRARLRASLDTQAAVAKLGRDDDEF